jgi:hypothetical protein
MLEDPRYIEGSLEEYLQVVRALVVTKGNLDSPRTGYTGMVVEFHAAEMTTRIEHQFETHKDHEEIAARNHAQQTQAEEQRADDQVMVESGSHRSVGFRVDALGILTGFNEDPSW